MNTPKPVDRLFRRLAGAGRMAGLALLSGLALAVGTVSVPNGNYVETVVDLSVDSLAGPVVWKREYTGKYWGFNRHWESLSGDFKIAAATQLGGGAAGSAGYTQGGTSSSKPNASAPGGGGGGCWIWVWDGDGGGGGGGVSIGNVSFGGNASHSMKPTGLGSSLAASGCGAASVGGVGGADGSLGGGVAEGMRRMNSLYVGGNGSYVYKNRYTLRNQDVSSFGGNGTEKGWRWADKSGDWIEYDAKGRVLRYGNNNQPAIELERDASGRLIALLEAQSRRVLITLHYQNAHLVEVRDVPVAGLAVDLPVRSVKYGYNAMDQLTTVTDPLNRVSKYEYDPLGRLAKIIDAEERVTKLEYEGNSTEVKRMVAADGAVTDYSFEYDDAKQWFYSKVQGPVGADGRRVEDFTHDKSGALIHYEVNGRPEMAVQFDSAARKEMRTNARGFVTTQSKNEFEQITEIVYPDGSKTSTRYDARFIKPLEEVDQLGIKTLYEYDTRGNLRKRIAAAGLPEQQTTEYEVNALGQVVKVIYKGRTEADGRQTPDAEYGFEYDALGHYSKLIDAEGHAHTLVYDRAGNLRQRTDPLSRSTQFEVDAAGQLLSLTDAKGQVYRLEYDKVGNQLAETDARGKRFSTQYDAMNRPVRNQDANGAQAEVQYNGYGVPIRTVDEDGRVSLAEFDRFLRLVKQRDPMGNTTQLHYQVGADGQNAGVLGSLGAPTQTDFPTYSQQQRFDALERLTLSTTLNPGPLGTEGLVSQYRYDARGQLLEATDPKGKTSTHQYDALGRLLKTTNSLGKSAELQYDARGNLIGLKDPNGNQSRFELDRNDRVLKEIQPLGDSIEYAYNAAGEMVYRKDAAGQVHEYDYDALGNVREIKRRDAAGQLVRHTTLERDEEDNITAWHDIDATRPAGQQQLAGSMKYDDVGRLKEESLEVPDPQGGVYRWGYAYTYAPSGRKTSLTWPDGKVLGYGYSAHGELETVNVPEEGLIAVKQYKWTAPVKLTLPGGSTKEYTRDGLLSALGMTVRGPQQQPLLELKSNYGKWRELLDNTRSEAEGSERSVFGYDDTARLTDFTREGDFAAKEQESYTLDAMGNRIGQTRIPGLWQYDANNRLLRRGEGAAATQYEYDGNNNLRKQTEPGGRVSVYHYDVQNRLSAVSDGAGRLIARYGYDLFDRRLWKEQYRDVARQPLAQALRTYYLYADEGLIAEAQQPISLGADGSVSASQPPALHTLYGPTPNSHWGTDYLLLKTRNQAGEPVVAYYHHNEIKAPIQASDKQGNVLWSASYQPFGAASLRALAGAARIQSHIRLPGQYWDAETGLHYNYRRYYDPSTGRYISQDPIGLQGGLNRFRYAEADPVNRTDPTGEIVPLVVAAGICMAQCMAEEALWNAATGECSSLGSTAGSCAMECASGGLLKAAKWFRRGCNSFTVDTLVHVKPEHATLLDAQSGHSVLKPIGEIRVGDEVLAHAEWKERGSQQGRDLRLSYEKVLDVYSSHKPQQLVHITLVGGEVIKATEGHPFRTTEGWRDAVLLKRGGKLLLKDSGEEGERQVEIAAVRVETLSTQVLNLEVANAHTFFVGDEGALAHNGVCDKFLKPGKGRGTVPPSQRDPKRYYNAKDRQDGYTKCGGKCEGCGASKLLCELDAHHEKRHADGGRTDDKNKVMLCESCHKEIHK